MTKYLYQAIIDRNTGEIIYYAKYLVRPDHTLSFICMVKEMPKEQKHENKKSTTKK